MKAIRANLATVIPIALLALLSTLNSQLSIVFAQGTAFTYQGVLNAGGNPVTGPYDFNFNLFLTDLGGNPAAPAVPRTAVGVTNGLFVTTIGFGDIFTG